MELDTRELFCYQARAATTMMKNCATFQKWIAVHQTVYCFQSSLKLLEVSEVF